MILTVTDDRVDKGGQVAKEGCVDSIVIVWKTPISSALIFLVSRRTKRRTLVSHLPRSLAEPLDLVQGDLLHRLPLCQNIPPPTPHIFVNRRASP